MLKVVHTNAICDIDGLCLAKHGHPTVALLFLRACPVLVGKLGHRSYLCRQGLLSALSLLQTNNIWGLLTHPLVQKKIGQDMNVEKQLVLSGFKSHLAYL